MTAGTKLLYLFLLACLLSFSLIAEERVIPPEIRQEFQETFKAFDALDFPSYRSPTSKWGMTVDLDAALDRFIALMDRYPEYFGNNMSMPLSTDNFYRSLKKPQRFEEYIDRLLSRKSEYYRLHQNEGLLLSDLRINFREKWTDEEFAAKRHKYVEHLMELRQYYLLLFSAEELEKKLGHVRTDKAADYLVELYNTLPQKKDELNELFEKYEIDVPFRERVLERLNEELVSYAQRHEAATAPLHRFPAFQERCDAFLKQLDEAVELVKTKKVYEIDETKPFEEWSDEVRMRSYSIEKLFSAHNRHSTLGSAEEIDLCKFYRGDLADDVDWQRFRRCVGTMWLAYIGAMAESIDPDYVPKPVVSYSVFGNLGPEFRAKMEAQLRANPINSAEYTVQSRALRNGFFWAVREGLVILLDMYRSNEKTELAELLEKHGFPFELVFDFTEKTLAWWDTENKSETDWYLHDLPRSAELLVRVLYFDHFVHADGTGAQKEAQQARLKRGNAIWEAILKRADEPYRAIEEFQWPEGYTGSKDVFQIKDKELQQAFARHKGRSFMIDQWNCTQRSLRGEEYGPSSRAPLEPYRKLMAEILPTP